MPTRRARQLNWVGSTLDDLRRLPDEVQGRIGYALYLAQLGSKHQDATPMVGFGPGVLEVASRLDGNTYRAIYVVRFVEAVYVLHVFQKKAAKGVATPRVHLDLVKQRLKMVQQHREATPGHR
jgi:phage-related protein